jgi:hypothetical protein
MVRLFDDDMDGSLELPMKARMATIDCGANYHLFKAPEQFEFITTLPRPIRINVPSPCNHATMFAYEKGIVAMQVTDTDSCLHTLKLEGALLVPDLSTTDVISANKLIPDQVNSISLHNDEMRLDLNTRYGSNSCTVLIPSRNNVYSLASPAAPSKTFSSLRRLIPSLPATQEEQADTRTAFLHGDLSNDIETALVAAPGVGDSGASHCFMRDPYTGGHDSVTADDDDSTDDESSSQTGIHSSTPQQESVPCEHMHSTFGKKFSSDITGDGPGEVQPPLSLTIIDGRMAYRASIPLSHGSSLPTKPAFPVYLPRRTAVAQLLDYFCLPTPMKQILNIANNLQLTQFDVQNLFLARGSASHQGTNRPSTQAVFDSMTSHKLTARNWETICTILDGPASTFTESDSANLARFYRHLALICHHNGITRQDIQIFTTMSLAVDLASLREIRAKIPPRLIPLVSATDFSGCGRREYKIICYLLLQLHDGYITVGNDFGAHFDTSTNSAADLCAHIVATRTIFYWDQLDLKNYNADDDDLWGIHHAAAWNGGKPSHRSPPAISSAPILLADVPSITPTSTTADVPAISSHMMMTLPTSPTKRKRDQDDNDDSDDEDSDSDSSYHPTRERFWTGIANSSKDSPTAWQMCQCNTFDNCAE